MQYIALCIIPVLVEGVISKFLFTYISLFEQYDKRVKRECSKKSRKILFICPTFTRYLRMRTEGLCIGVELLLIVQLIIGLFDVQSFKEIYREQCFLVLEVLLGVTIMCSLFPSVWSILWEKLKIRRKEKSQRPVWDMGEDIEEKEYLFNGNLIEKIKISYEKGKIPQTLFVLLPPNHKINFAGFLKGSKESFHNLKKILPFMESEELIIGNPQIYKEAVSKLQFFVEYSNHSSYLHNYGNYRALSNEVNRTHIATLRIEYTITCDENEYKQLENELDTILLQIKKQYGFSDIIFCGHGPYGAIEAVLLSQTIKSKGLCILGEIGIGLRQLEQASIESSYDKRWITKRQYKNKLQSLEESNNRYYKSLICYTSEYLADVVNKYQNFILNIRFGNDIYLCKKNESLRTADSLKTYFLKDTYSTFRQAKGKDYMTMAEVTRCELKQNIKSTPGTLVLERDVEISEELIDIIKKELKLFL